MFARSVFWFAVVALLPAVATADEPLFPFVVSYDAPDNATNVAAWLEKPAGKDGFVRVNDGRLTVLRDQRPAAIHFLATNFCFGACFPTHEQAERVAARLARVGINCVRLHHMDNRDIWGKSKDQTIIDPDQLDKLDYLIYQFKLHGVYTNINLHVSRWLGEKEGFSGRDQRPNYDKGLDNFEPRMIALQKKYARDLLTHVNPYTKTAYVDEPAIAFVEINNENALFAEWGNGAIDRLGEPYAGTFRTLWNAWLKKKYGTTEKLRQAWHAGEQPLGAELLNNGDFSKPGTQGWYFETDEQTKATLSPGEGGPDGKRRLKITVVSGGRITWHPQLVQSGLPVKQGQAYTLTLTARADKRRDFTVNCMMAHDPWNNLGFTSRVDVGTEWQTIRRTFLPNHDDTNARITITSLRPGTYELANVSLRPGGIVGLAKNQRLEDDSVPVLLHGQLNTTPPAHADFIQFLWDTERDYWWGMHKFLKEELKVHALVAGTQLGYSPVYVQAGLDYIDAHSYWHHPHFPGRPWDPQNWTVKNEALVNFPAGTLGGLAAKRVAGMAFTVSEYNHPAPNSYAAEGLPMMSALAALQSWDAIYSFCYSHGNDFEPRKITGFFDIKGDPSRIVHSPACAAMFVRGDVAPARQTLLAPLTPARELEILERDNAAWNVSTAALGLDARASLLHGIAMRLDRTGNAADSVKPLELPKTTRQFVADTGQVRWDASEKNAGYFTVDAPRTKLFTGFVHGRTFALGDVGLKIGPTRLDWATVSLVCLDGAGFDRPGRVLVAATGWVQNKDWQLRELPGGNITLDNHWGTEPVLCEGVPAEIRLPVAARRATLYPLDESGRRRSAVAVGDDNGRAVLSLGPKHQTLWYEVEIGGK